MQVSNTGKTITIRMPNGLVGHRYTVTLTHNNVVLIKADPKGHKVHASNCLTLDSHHYPNWPHHGRLHLEHLNQENIKNIRGNLPDGPLPEPRPQTRRKPKNPEPVIEINNPPLTDYFSPMVQPPIEPTEEVVFSFKSRIYEFHVPASELIDLAILWGSKGYGRPQNH